MTLESVAGFWKWFDAARGDLSVRQVEKRARCPRGRIGNVYGAGKEPTYSVCEAIADGLGIDRVEVFRRAGLLPPLPQREAEIEEASAILRTLPAQTRATVLDMLRGLGDGRPRSQVRTWVDEVVELFEGLEGGEEAQILLDECRRLVAEVRERRD